MKINILFSFLPVTPQVKLRPVALDLFKSIYYYYYYYYIALAQHEKKDLVFLSAGYTSSQATYRSLRSRVSFAESLLSLRVPHSVVLTPLSPTYNTNSVTVLSSVYTIWRYLLKHTDQNGRWTSSLRVRR